MYFVRLFKRVQMYFVRLLGWAVKKAKAELFMQKYESRGSFFGAASCSLK